MFRKQFVDAFILLSVLIEKILPGLTHILENRHATNYEAYGREVLKCETKELQESKRIVFLKSVIKIFVLQSRSDASVLASYTC